MYGRVFSRPCYIQSTSFNNRTCLKSKIFTDEWKIANIGPFQNSSNKLLVDNNHPVSQLPVPSETFENLKFGNFLLICNKINFSAALNK